MSATLPLDRSSARQAQRSSPGPRRLRRSVAPYLFITPFLVVFAAFVMVPLCYAFYLSLFQDKLVGGRHFSGIANYVDVFGDNAFWEGVWHMLLFGIVQVPVMLALSLAMALILDHGVVWLRGAFRIAFFIPYAVPSVVATLIWGYLYGKSFGPFSQAAHALGLPTIDFLSSRWMLPSLANVVTWEFVGYNMVILYSALQAVPADLAEAAAMDGASPLQTALLVKVPSIRGALLLTAIFSIIGTLQLFNEPQLLKAAAPSVIGDHYTPNVYAYALAFTDQQYNYSAAVSFVLGALIAVISYGFMLSTRDKGEPG